MRNTRRASVLVVSAVIGSLLPAALRYPGGTIEAAWRARITVKNLTLTPTSLTGGSAATATVTISQFAPRGGYVVSLSSSNPAVAQLPSSSVTIPAGRNTAQFTVNTVPTLSSLVAVISATLHGTASASLTVSPPQIAAVVLTPATLTGGGSCSGTVMLNAAAPAGGAKVTLTSSSAIIAVPSTVSIPAGAESAVFTASSGAVSSPSIVNITASFAGSSLSATLTVNPPVIASLSFSPASVISGQVATGTITLNGPAPSGGLSVTLLSTNSAAFPVTTQVVAQNATSLTFPVTAGGVASATVVMITGTTGATSASPWSETVLPVSVTLSALTFNPTSVTGGTSSTGTLTINVAAPPGGVSVSLSSPDPSVSVPASVMIAAGKTTQSFTATTTGVATTANQPVMVTAKLGTSSAGASIQVNPAVILSFSISPTAVTGGAGSIGNLTLSGPAPPAGLTVTLASMTSMPGAAAVPANFTIPANASSGTFNIGTFPVAATATVGITPTLPSGATTGSATLTVNAPVVTSVSFNPGTVVSSQITTGTVMLNGGAPTGGFTVNLSSNNTSAFPVQATVVVPANNSTQTFMTTAGAVGSSTTVTVTAASGTASVQGNVTVIPALTVSTVTFSPSTVTGGTSSQGTVTLSQGAPTGGTTVTLSSSDPSVTVPGSIMIAQGKTSQTFTATTVGVATTANQPVVVTATAGASNAVGNLQVNPAVISSYMLSPGTVTGGSSATGTLMLSGPAPPAGLTVTLASVISNPAAATVPASFNLAGGATMGSFTVTTSPVAATATANITPTLPSGNTTGAATVTINAPVPQSVAINATIGYGQTAKGTVTLTGPAPSSGTLSVNLVSNDAGAALPTPAAVTVPAGASRVNFTATAQLITSVSSPFSFSASSGGSTPVFGGTLVVLPPLSTSVAGSGLAFPATPVDCQTAPAMPPVSCDQLPVTLTNNSAFSLTISSTTPTTTTGASGNNYGIGTTNSCIATLPPMAGASSSCLLDVTFAPTQGGLIQGNLNVTGMVNGNPLSISAALSGTGQHWIGLTWTEPPPTAGVTYNVYRGTMMGGPYSTRVATCTGIGTLFCADSDPTLVTSQTYCYVVTAVLSGIESADSNETCGSLTPP